MTSLIPSNNSDGSLDSDADRLAREGVFEEIALVEGDDVVDEVTAKAADTLMQTVDLGNSYPIAAVPSVDTTSETLAEPIQTRTPRKTFQPRPITNDAM